MSRPDLILMPVSVLAKFIGSFLSYLPPGIVLSILSAFIVDRTFLTAYRHEFRGTLTMIAFTFSAGKWVGSESWEVAWFAHFLGVIAADKLSGGPHVNPAVSVSMWSLGKCTYTEMYVRIAGQMGGGLVAFPLYSFLSQKLGLNALGGPEFSLDDDDAASSIAAAAMSEYFATLLLCFLIYLVNWELNFGTYHYWIKQSLTAISIRYLIVIFPTAGPSMNPMLGTAWAVFNSSTTGFPQNFEHYYVYWISPILGALTASFVYAVYSGDLFFGSKLPFGPIATIPIGGGPATPSAPSKKSD